MVAMHLAMLAVQVPEVVEVVEEAAAPIIILSEDKVTLEK
jgi:hypothetical protein